MLWTASSSSSLKYIVLGCSRIGWVILNFWLLSTLSVQSLTIPWSTQVWNGSILIKLRSLGIGSTTQLNFSIKPCRKSNADSSHGNCFSVNTSSFNTAVGPWVNLNEIEFSLVLWYTISSVNVWSGEPYSLVTLTVCPAVRYTWLNVANNVFACGGCGNVWSIISAPLPLTRATLI